MQRWLKVSWSKGLIVLMAFLVLTACSSPKGAMDNTSSKQVQSNSGAMADSNSATANVVEAGKTSLATQAKEDPSRKIIYKANLEMPVKDYRSAQEKLRQLISASGGYILDFTENTTNNQISGSFIIKIEAGQFAPLLDQLETISPSMQRSVKGEDVSEEYVDLTARLKAKQTVESRLLSFMEKATKSDELLAYSTELGKVQEEIERIKGRKNYLDQNVAYSTIQLQMYQNNNPAPVNPNKETFGGEIASAFGSSVKSVLAFFKSLVVFLTAIIPALIPLAIILVPIWILVRKRQKRKGKEWDLRYQNRSEVSLNRAEEIQEEPIEGLQDNDDKELDERETNSSEVAPNNPKKDN
ncbi:DUF4349 domain-containing protein [Paenibacillus sp. N1-5-1-14]|uniref:DUF4349 domain-containing protein n=1 Tax=Paenibacillus radicibacter TaxID=2972488 RepID=UPI002159414E|nr:DUF4349 domain-containing protein [Paenibacillus radicibacter]MCR8641927.1 DUF4349 domain-containing protein [Paenibacillus radicibacter]